MAWTEEKRMEVGIARKAALAALTPEERAARTAAGREKSRNLAIARRHERWAAEMRDYGWTCLNSDQQDAMERKDWLALGGWTSGPCATDEPCGG